MKSFILSNKTIPDLTLFHNAIKAVVPELDGILVDENIVTILLSIDVTQTIINTIEAIIPPSVPNPYIDIIINEKKQKIVPKTLPNNPESGDFIVDNSDNKLKVYNASCDRWIILGDASDTYFDNSIIQLPNSPSNVQDAIEKLNASRFQYLQYQFIGQMNYDQYLYSNNDSVSGLLGSARRSGNESNGYRYGNSSPLTVAFNGHVSQATASITGIAVSTGSPTSTIELKFELWKIGFNNEGTKLGNITFNISTSGKTIGTYWNSSVLTSYGEAQTQNVNVTAGDLLGLKFISQTGNNKVVAVTNTTIVLQINGSI